MKSSGGRPLMFWLWVLALGLLVAGLVAEDMELIRRTATYGNFDRPNTGAYVASLMPGTEDHARLRVYRYDKAAHVHAHPWSRRRPRLSIAPYFPT